MEEPKSSSLWKWLLAVLIVLIIVFLVLMAWGKNLFGSGNATPTPTPTLVPTTTSTVIPLNANTATPGVTATPTLSPWQTYTYSNLCSYTLTFPKDWQGYKGKTAKIDGESDTIYFEVPTTDKTSPWNVNEITHDAGYSALFAIGVYTNAEWTTAAADPAEPPTQVGKCGNYTIGYSDAQAYPQDIQDKNLAKEVKAIIATFKTL